ncbi:hypothetical protein [Staphylococcus capitis]|nr:hypothetical protein [Staphylococcus capitis]
MNRSDLTMIKDNKIIQRMIQDKMNEQNLDLLLRILNNLFELEPREYTRIKNSTEQIVPTLEKKGGYLPEHSKHILEKIFFRLADCECEVESEMNLYFIIIDQEVIYENIVNELRPNKDNLNVELDDNGEIGAFIKDYKEIQRISEKYDVDITLVIKILHKLQNESEE